MGSRRPPKYETSLHGRQRPHQCGTALHPRGERNTAAQCGGDSRCHPRQNGVGTYTICKIMASIELGKRRQLATMGLRPDISSAEPIFNYMRPIMQDLTIEAAHVMLLTQNFKLIKEMRVSQGGLTEVGVDVRMIIKEAVLNNATELAFVHNHPSGNIHPSKFDDTLTQTLKKACDLMRIHFLDHVIVCDGDYYSYHDRGRL